MGASAAETVREIEQTRARLDSEIRELEQRLPAPARWAKRVVGVAVGGGVSGAAFWFAAKRLRRKKAQQKAKERPVQAVVNVLPERWADAVSEKLEDERWKQWAAVVGGAWLLFKVAELRQMRRMNRALLAGARPLPA
jgi:hypothetical protein